MVTIGLLPLDERPCNFRFPMEICQDSSDVNLLLPPKEVLGRKKTPADHAGVIDWLRSYARQCDALVISLDMLVYGGIVPSRLHQLTVENCLQRLTLIDELRKIKPSLKLYGFSLIMRAPAYDSSEEEPDYYASFGKALYYFGQSVDMESISDSSSSKLFKSKQTPSVKSIPPEVIADFRRRRNTNNQVNLAAIDLVRKGMLDFLVIPLDDCSRYGWAPREQRLIRKRIIEYHLGTRIHVYSGADDVGTVLVARAANELMCKTPRVFTRTSATGGGLIIPKFEDRMFGESVKWQIVTAGGLPWSDLKDVDFVLLTNAPTASGNDMAEAPLSNNNRHPSYNTDRCLPEFVLAIKTFAEYKPIALADVAMTNGADDELMNLLACENLLGLLSAYGGWNTSANAMGTCIAQAMLNNNNIARPSKFTIKRIIEDWGYMVHLREQVTRLIEKLGGNAVSLKDNEAQLATEVREGLNYFMANTMPTFACDWNIHDVSFPWKRLFEIDFSLSKNCDTY